MSLYRCLIAVCFALATSGCMHDAATPPVTGVDGVIYAAPGTVPATGGPLVPVVAFAPPGPVEEIYTLDTGDKLRVVVFGQEGLTNSYIVGADGNLTMPLIGAVKARGLTTRQLQQTVRARLARSFIREPHVAVEIETYRPFFILGEVTAPGQYPYVPNMTIETAVAIAGGFTPRANQKSVHLTRPVNDGQTARETVPVAHAVRPGDTIVVKERWF
jgi:polysaccharide export outer membrane protein